MTKKNIGDIRPEAVGAFLVLDTALLRLTEAGRSTPCQNDPTPFFDDDKATRTEAAEACGLCPVRRQCATFAEANDERGGVWGGRDTTPKAYNRKTTTTQEI